MKKDNFTCQSCLKMFNRDSELCAHHVYSFDTYEELRYDVTNGVVLCVECHSAFHKKYGKGNNNLAQFLEFIK